MDAEVTHDAVLGGRLWLWQPRHGYRVGVDAILLAAAVPARAGQSVLDLGCGVGGAVLALACRVPGLALTGVEVQADYAALAVRNADAAGVTLRVVQGDVAALPVELRQQAFDHVLMNPPYFDRSASVGSADPGRDRAMAGAGMDVWINTAARRLAPRGTLTLIQRSARLPEILGALTGRLGSVAVLPLAARTGRVAEHVIVRAVKGGRAAFRLLPSVILHDGDRHLGDAENYTPRIRAVLRDCVSLPWVD